MTLMRLKLSTALVLASAALAACTGTSGQSNSTSAPSGNPAAANVAGFARFTDIPMPSNNSLDLDRTMIFGADRDWIGRVSLTAPITVNDAYDFYKREMPRLGWTELTSVRSATSVLSYQLDNRVATIQVTARRSLIGNSSQIDFWMNPKAGGGASTFSSAGGSSGSYSPPAYTPPASGNFSSGGSSGGIQSAPLR
jgi:hypothetical protein